MFTGLIEEAGQVVWLRQSSSKGLQLQIVAPAIARSLRRGESVSVNGISLTVAEKHPGSFVCWIIPETRRLTNLRGLRPGDLVNLEFDVLAKYLEAQLGRFQERSAD